MSALSEISEQDRIYFAIVEYIFFDARCRSDLSTEAGVWYKVQVKAVRTELVV